MTDEELGDKIMLAILCVTNYHDGRTYGEACTALGSIARELIREAARTFMETPISGDCRSTYVSDCSPYVKAAELFEMPDDPTCVHPWEHVTLNVDWQPFCSACSTVIAEPAAAREAASAINNTDLRVIRIDPEE